MLSVFISSDCWAVRSEYSTFHVFQCWEPETSYVGSLGIPSGVSCPSAGACILDCVAASGAGPHRPRCAYQCWSGSLPEPWGLGGCLGGAPNTWMDTGWERRDGVRCALQRENLDLTGINWDRSKWGNIRRRLMISQSGWRSYTSPALPLLQRSMFACCPQRQG